MHSCRNPAGTCLFAPSVPLSTSFFMVCVSVAIELGVTAHLLVERGAQISPALQAAEIIEAEEYFDRGDYASLGASHGPLQ
jgi:hypothetical protein